MQNECNVQCRSLHRMFIHVAICRFIFTPTSLSEYTKKWNFYRVGAYLDHKVNTYYRNLKKRKDMQNNETIEHNIE